MMSKQDDNISNEQEAPVQTARPEVWQPKDPEAPSVTQELPDDRLQEVPQQADQRAEPNQTEV